MPLEADGVFAAAALMSVQFAFRMQGRVSPDVPQPTVPETLYQLLMVTFSVFSGKLKALPDSEMRPLTMEFSM